MFKTALLFSLLLLSPDTDAQRRENDFFRVNNGKPLLDAHNCYPYDGKWADRIDRALRLGFPVGIEQDVAPYQDPQSGLVTPKVTHNEQANAGEPALKEHFFERVRPIVERALKEKHKDQWPLIVVHFDFKNNSTETLEAVWNLLGEYQDWITTAPKTKDDRELAELDWKPLLVLTEENDHQEDIFYRRLAVGDKLRLFGSGHTNTDFLEGLNREQKIHAIAQVAPSVLLSAPATNYRRWWNSSWLPVEEGGQQRAGEWTPADQDRLKTLVDHAHRLGYWIRFYTLDGFAPASPDYGWGKGYNFGSQAAVEKRWAAAASAGVNFVASDQYEDLRRFLESR